MLDSGNTLRRFAAYYTTARAKLHACYHTTALQRFTGRQTLYHTRSITRLLCSVLSCMHCIDPRLPRPQAFYLDYIAGKRFIMRQLGLQLKI